MKTDPILEEVWRVKDKLSREMAADPEDYFAKLDERTKAEERAGRRVVRSVDELRNLTDLFGAPVRFDGGDCAQ